LTSSLTFPVGKSFPVTDSRADEIEKDLGAAAWSAINPKISSLINSPFSTRNSARITFFVLVL
jgi:hypothetical protein